MKFYVASLYGEKNEARRLADNLTIAGHECTARWFDGGVGSSGAEHRANADMDLEDIRRADVLILRTKPPGTMYTGGGRYVEFGYALALGKPIIILGPVGETVFHYATGDIRYALTHREVVSLMGAAVAAE